jgi:Rps23 Pro-64 3,4-dihydroxylase Tpa1-like proline 4-hydroxylase
MKLILIFLFIIFLLFILEYYCKSYYIVKKNFLDKKFIEKINKIILNDNEWLYTTNIGNDKVKHNNDIKSRRENSLKLLNSDKFSYSKYEYKNEAPILKEITEYLNSPDVLKQISELTNKKITKTTDIFISKFEPGDFLSVHNDINLGRYAFIIYLNKSWDRSCGGDLNLITKEKIHIPIYPEYNKLVLMDIKSIELPHYINTVKCNNRYAITGWFM